MKKTIILLLISTICFAQNANRKIIEVEKHGNQFNIFVSDGYYMFRFLNDKIVQTTFIPKNENLEKPSEAVVIKSDNKKLISKDVENNFELSTVTSKVKIKIQKNPFRISYFYNGKEIISEKKGYIKKETSEILEFNLDQTEVLYGGGARALGMNRRGNRLEIYNRAKYGYEDRAELMNFCIPMVLSSKKYAIHFDNSAIGFLDLDSKKDNTLAFETISGRKTYQIIVGDDWQEIIENYTILTGKQPMPARWTLGNFSSRFGYHTQEEVEKTIKKFEDEKIPVDAIILDLYWFGKTIKGTMGNLDWDKDNFPNPSQMISNLNNKGIKTILITEPFILTNSGKWQEAVDKKILATDATGNPSKFDFYFGNTGIVDIFKPEGKTWFWNIYKDLINQGVGGLWGDLGEPEVFPSSAITTAGKADEVHNIYGHQWAKLIADGYKKDFPTVRPFILMRAGYSGSQQFGMIPWSGDVNRSWGGLQSQPEIALQMGMQGMAYMHSDLGGFAGDYFDNELYIRWLQYGVFNPIFRPHAQEEVASEAVYKDIITKEKAKKQIELRYQLLPYNYTLAYENTLSGIPLMRPLLFEEPDNKALSTVCENYLWGNDFLVSPITKSNIRSQKIYFPKTNNWYDFYSDAKFIAGTTENVLVAENYIPTFVRAGAFIPMIKTIQNTKDYSLENFDLHFYYDSDCKKSVGKLFNDDGVTPNNIENGKYEILKFESQIEKNILNIKFKTEIAKNFTASNKVVNLIIHNSNAKKVIINGMASTFKNQDNKTEIIINWTQNAFLDLKIEL